jgi:hypothetical protein
VNAWSAVRRPGEGSPGPSPGEDLPYGPGTPGATARCKVAALMPSLSVRRWPDGCWRWRAAPPH